jgi:hypothetical protein
MKRNSIRPTWSGKHASASSKVPLIPRFICDQNDSMGWCARRRARPGVSFINLAGGVLADHDGIADHLGGALPPLGPRGMGFVAGFDEEI